MRPVYEAHPDDLDVAKTGEPADQTSVPRRRGVERLHPQQRASLIERRGLGRGHFFTREGQLVATVMQQGLMRYR